MRKLPMMLLCGAVFAVGAVALATPSDARRFGGARMGGGHAFAHARVGRAHRGDMHRNISRNVNINRNVARHVDRNVNRYVYRNGRRGFWRNGVWVAAPVVAGTAYVASCAYEYNRWQSTGSAYWRDRYYQCVR